MFSLRMGNVSNVDDYVCEMYFIESCLEALDEAMGKICDETDSVEENCVLSVWQAKASV